MVVSCTASFHFYPSKPFLNGIKENALGETDISKCGAGDKDSCLIL